MTRFSEQTFTNAETLHCASTKHVHRNLGVRISGAYTHKGFTPPREVVEIERETLMVNTSTSVRLAVDIENWRHEAKECTRLVIRDLDEVIAELTAHRNRLQQSIYDPAIH